MTPETLRRRIAALQQRAADARPMPAATIVLAALGESPEDAKKRAGVEPGAFCIVVKTIDASTPREATP